MSPLNNSQFETIIKRLAFARIELGDLKEYQDISSQIYQEDRQKRRNLERIIENLVNSASDIAKVIMAGENLEIPETYRDVFLILGKLNIIPPDIAQQLADLSKLRNVLAHQYLDIKWEALERFLKTGIPIIASFLESIEKNISANHSN